jgi:uncharacterized membrane protein
MKVVETGTSPTLNRAIPRGLISAGILFGMGFAAFFDGIVLHQILQWHHLLTSVHPIRTLDDVSVNTLADGLFHLLAYFLTIAGVIVLWQTHQHTELPKSARPIIGAILMGAGLFNFFEGLINHQILGIHHVRSVERYMVWDIAFLGLGLLLILLGKLVIQRYQSHPTD